MQSKRLERSITACFLMLIILGVILVAGCASPPPPTTFPANTTAIAQAVEATLKAQVSTNPTLAPTPTVELYPECVAYMEQENFAVAGECYEDYEAFHKAAESYKQLTLAEPTDYWAFENLARVYQLIDEWSLALSAEQQALSLARTPEERAEAHLGIGVTHYNMGAYELAINSFEIGVQTEQTIPGLRTNLQVWLAWAYKADGQQEQACKYFEQALQSAQEQDYTWAINHAKEGLAGCK
jgi:tetratricopeptide (TPR) repeat protein